ncbi:MAG TPA: LysR family transcriptional regulator [Acidimicrobiales bacterium]|nr:LysR family transcriptional regulator [Acidimicrobiales bacterium]
MHDLRRLRAFHEVAERGSFSAAALALGYAQSVVSHHIAALEAEHGITLVDRTSRPVRLTPAGEQLEAHAVDVLGSVAAAEDTLRALAGVRRGVLRIGAFDTACTSFVPVAMARFERAHPGVQVTLDVDEPTAALRRVRAGDLDLAVAFIHRTADHGVVDDALTWTVLGTDPFRLVLPPGHRLAGRRRLRPADLARERFCAPPREGSGLTYHEMLDKLGAEGGFRPVVAYTVAGVDVARALVAAGLGIAVMGQHTIPPGDATVVVRPLPGQSAPERTVFAAWLRDRRVPALDRMLPLLQAAAGEAMRR